MSETKITVDDKSQVYSENCQCHCGCKYFCRPRDNGECKFCAQGHHADKEHFFDIIADEFQCYFCGMPVDYENLFPKCHRIKENELKCED